MDGSAVDMDCIPVTILYYFITVSNCVCFLYVSETRPYVTACIVEPNEQLSIARLRVSYRTVVSRIAYHFPFACKRILTTVENLCWANRLRIFRSKFVPNVVQTKRFTFEENALSDVLYSRNDIIFLTFF